MGPVGLLGWNPPLLLLRGLLLQLLWLLSRLLPPLACPAFCRTGVGGAQVGANVMEVGWGTP
jgi:hypothetical protein